MIRNGFINNSILEVPNHERTSQERSRYEHLRGKVRRAHPATPSQGKTLRRGTRREKRDFKDKYLQLGIRPKITYDRPVTRLGRRIGSENRENSTRTLKYFPLSGIFFFLRKHNVFQCLRDSIKRSEKIFSTFFPFRGFLVFPFRGYDVIIPIQDLTAGLWQGLEQKDKEQRHERRNNKRPGNHEANFPNSSKQLDAILHRQKRGVQNVFERCPGIRRFLLWKTKKSGFGISLFSRKASERKIHSNSGRSLGNDDYSHRKHSTLMVDVQRGRQLPRWFQHHARKPLSGLASQKFQRRKRPDRQPLNLTSGGSWPVFLLRVYHYDTGKPIT